MLVTQSQIDEATQYYIDNNHIAACYIQRKYKVTRTYADNIRMMIITQSPHVQYKHNITPIIGRRRVKHAG